MATPPPIDPMHQFLVEKLIPIEPINIGGFVLDMSITNSVAMMLIGLVLMIAFFLLTARGQVVPNRAQALGEGIYNIVDRVLVLPIIGPAGRPYVPFIFSLFMLIFILNLMSVLFAITNVAGIHAGDLHFTFTVTAQLAVTAALAVIAFFTVFILGFIKHGPKFLGLFFPSGMGVIGAILMAPIEMLSYFVRPITLAMRLFGNMLGGHVVMSLFGSFVVALGFAAISDGFGHANDLLLVPSALSFLMIVALTGLELVVALLQAFVFAALTTVYLNEVVNFGHGH